MAQTQECRKHNEATLRYAKKQEAGICTLHNLMLFAVTPSYLRSRGFALTIRSILAMLASTDRYNLPQPLDNRLCGVYNVDMAILKNGYVYLWDAKRKRHSYEHRLVIEKFLGRKLLPTETIHHKNGIKHDNRIENLVLCKTVADHVQEEGQWGPIKQKTCNLCDKPHHAKGLCNNHYMQMLRTQLSKS